MAAWSGMRNKLENEYLAQSLRGRIQYYCTSYTQSADQNGRASIRLDGKELISGCYWNMYGKARLFPHDDKYEQRMRWGLSIVDETALKLGVFDESSFYRAFYIFDNQSIEKSLCSDNLLVRIFAVLDRRVGKRRLRQMRDSLKEEDEIFNLFYVIRADAEHILDKSKNPNR